MGRHPGTVVLLAFLTAVASVCLRPGLAAADWQVKRRGNAAAVAQAVEALLAHPDDAEVNRRLRAAAGRAGLARILGEVRGRHPLPTRYEPAEAIARLLAACERHDEAAAAFAAAARLRPELAAPHAGRAAALSAQGRTADAFAALAEARARARGPTEQRRYILAELALCRAGDTREREVTLRRELLTLAPDDGAALALGEALERAGRPREAADVLAQRLASSGRTSPARRLPLLLRAAAWREAGGEDVQAEALALEAIEALPPSDTDRRREAWQRALEIARRRDSLPALAARLAALRRRGPAEWEAVALTRDELGDPEGALEALRRLAALEPRAVGPRRLQLGILERLGRDGEVAALYQELARLQPGDARLAVEIVERAFRRGPRDEARRQFDEATRRAARTATALAALADLAARWGEEARALKIWERLQALSPHDEGALLGLGEAHFQRGRRDVALKTWRRFLDEPGTSRARALGRLAEVLLDHEMLSDAAAAAQAAVELEPDEPRHHRTLARVYERQRQANAAVAEWDAVLEHSRGDDRSGNRREARARIVSLLLKEGAQDGRKRLAERLSLLDRRFREHPEDRESALFLVEARLRLDRVAEATAVLRTLAERDPADAESVLALVRLLRRRDDSEAARWLTELARRAPGRAREAEMQLAEIAAARYDDAGARRHAETARSLGADDPLLLTRLADLAERTGDPEGAANDYRRAVERGAPPGAAFAWARLQVRRGDAAGAADTLRQVLRHASDEETVADAARRALDVEEYSGSLVELERVVAGLGLHARAGAAHRRILIDLYRRLLPSLYHAAWHDPEAAGALARVGRHALRPLLELVTDAETDPDRAVIDLLGMLGNPDATPALARLATWKAPAPGGATSRQGGAPPNEIDVRLAALVALGRLGDERAGPTLIEATGSGEATLRAAAVWALGRLGLPAAAPILAELASSPSRPDVGALACLGLGRLGGMAGSVFPAMLATLAARPNQPLVVRRAAALALGRTRDSSAVGVLLPLLDDAEESVATAAAVALASVADRRTLLPLLLHRALLGAPGAAAAAWAGLDALAPEQAGRDEAPAIAGRIDVEGILTALAPPAGGLGADRRSGLLAGHEGDLATIVRAGLDRHRDARLRMLTALDTRDDGLGLGALAPPGTTPLRSGVAAVLASLGQAMRPALIALLDTADPPTRRLALRLCAKLGATEVDGPRIASAIADPAAGVSEAGVLAAEMATAGGRLSTEALGQAVDPLLEPGTDALVRRKAVRLLGAAPGPGTQARLIRALADDTALVRSEAAAALAGRPGAASSLAAVAADPSPAVRRTIASSLCRLPVDVAALARAALRQDPDALVRAAARCAEVGP